MIPGFVDGLQFKNVKVASNIEVGYVIEFTLNGCDYGIVVGKEPKGYTVQVQHGEPSNEICEYCGEKRTFILCEGLEIYMDEIFERLKEFPSVRLRLLF